jgi:hypothetical protein
MPSATPSAVPAKSATNRRRVTDLFVVWAIGLSLRYVVIGLTRPPGWFNSHPMGW